jgi:GntR family transcriptional regulator
MQYNAIDELGEIRRRCGVAYYHQLYRLLSAALGDGLIAPGSALPSETELMERFELSRNTVRRAFARLEQEKRIVRRRGSGTFARSIPRPSVSADRVAAALEDQAGEGPQNAGRLLRIQTSVTPEFIRRRDPRFGEQSLLVQRARRFQNLPVLVSTSYIPGSLSARLTRRQLARQSVSSALAAIGIVPRSAEQTMIAQAADSFIARHLGIEAASAVLCIQRLVRDAEDCSIEHQSHYLHPDRFQIRTLLALEQTKQGVRWSDTQSRQLPEWL